MTGRCYKHSLKISPENTTLLIEYGTFSYSIHSFCSRLLKQVCTMYNNYLTSACLYFILLHFITLKITNL